MPAKLEIGTMGRAALCALPGVLADTASSPTPRKAAHWIFCSYWRSGSSPAPSGIVGTGSSTGPLATIYLLDMVAIALFIPERKGAPLA